jgi:hypothetical protein
MANVHEKAVETLLRLRLELIQGIATAGESGGAGMSQRLAPTLVTVQQAIDILEVLASAEEKDTVAERMAAMRAKRNQK